MIGFIRGQGGRVVPATPMAQRHHGGGTKTFLGIKNTVFSSFFNFPNLILLFLTGFGHLQASIQKRQVVHFEAAKGRDPMHHIKKP